MDKMMEKFKTAIDALAVRFVAAIGGYSAPGVKSALYVAEEWLRSLASVWNKGGVYDPEFPVRFAIIIAALEKAPFGIEDDWEYDFLYQSSTRKYTTDGERWSSDGWSDLIKEVDEFGEKDMMWQAEQVKKLATAHSVRVKQSDWDRIVSFGNPNYIVKLEKGDDYIVYVENGSDFDEFVADLEKLGVNYTAA